MSYQHLRLEERYCLAEFREKGLSIRAIARILKRSPSTISRELRRNRGKRGYHPYGAYSKAVHRRRMPRRLLKGFEAEKMEYVVTALSQWQLFDTLPAYQAGTIARNQRKRTPSAPREAKGEAPSQLQHDSSGTHYTRMARGDTAEEAHRGLGRRYAVWRRGKRGRSDVGRPQKRLDMWAGGSFQAGIRNQRGNS